MLREPGLDILTLEPILHQELEWALRHGHEWTSRRRLETHITSRDRLAIAGQLTAGIVHDINNPLMAAKTNLDLAMEAICAGDKIPRLMTYKPFEKVSQTHVRVSKLLKRLLATSPIFPERQRIVMNPWTFPK